MAKTRIEWDYGAAGEIMLRSKEIAEVCEREAERMTRATGMDYISDVRVGSQRVRAGAYGKAQNGKQDICPACGRSHPNCDCKK